MKFQFNIRQKLTLQFLLLVGILFLFLSVSLYFFSDLYLEKRFFKRLQDRAVTTSTLFFDLQTTNKTLMKIVDGTDKEYLSEEVVSIYEKQRDLFLFTTNLKKEEFHRFFINELDYTNNVNYLSLLGNKMTALHISDKENDYWVLVSAKDKTGNQALKDLKNILIILAIVAFLFIGLMGWYFAEKALSPISGIIGQLNNIFPKNLNKRIAYTNFEDEIGELANTINQLLDRVETSVFTQKMFVANISHEIKNPLTKIFTQIELLEMKCRDNPIFHEKIVSLRDDTLKLNNLTHSILQLANIISDNAPLPMSAIRIDETIWDSVKDIKKWNQDLKIVAKFGHMPESEDKYWINGNEDALKIVFKNLIDNAYKFSNNKTAIINISFENNQALISITSEGILIPEEDISNLFQPFFRIDATAKGKAGHGIGLAIVKKIVELHGGKINAYSFEKGNTFEVRLNTL